VVNAKLGRVEFQQTMSPEFEGKYEVPLEWLRRCLLLAAKFAAKDAGRYALSAAHFHVEGDVIEFCATDGRRLVHSEERVLSKVGNPADTILFPAAECNTAGMAIAPTTNLTGNLCAGSRWTGVEYGNMNFYAAQVEGQYPAWKGVIPKPGPLATLDGKYLSKYMSILDRLEVSTARFESDGKHLRIYGKSLKVPEVDTTIDVPIAACKMYLVPELLAGALFEHDVFKFGWSEDGATAAFFSSGQFTALCMGAAE